MLLLLTPSRLSEQGLREELSVREIVSVLLDCSQVNSWETSVWEAERFFASLSRAGVFILPAPLINPRTIRAIGPEPAQFYSQVKKKK